jgi:hypothetical protein
MSDKTLQSYPPTGTGRAVLRFGVRSRWGATPENLRDTHLLRNWFEYDSEVSGAGLRKGINWYVIFGMALVIGVSASFWTGVGLMVTRYWR